MESSVLTGKEWRTHLQNLREKRQEQLHVTIEECQRLQHLHRELFNRQFQAQLKFIVPTEHRPKNPMWEDLKPPRDFTALIQRRLSSDNDEHQFRIENDKHRSQTKFDSRLPTHSHGNQRRLSVSTVDLKEKHANKVFENWPDYNEISQIVGFRIEPPKVKLSTTTDGRGATKKGNSSSRLVAATKQITRLVNLNAIATRRPKASEGQSEKVPLLSDVMAIRVAPPPSTSPRLPSSLCPSSMIFSQRLETRQWLLRNNFSQHATRTCPLL